MRSLVVCMASFMTTAAFTLPPNFFLSSASTCISQRRVAVLNSVQNNNGEKDTTPSVRHSLRDLVKTGELDRNELNRQCLEQLQEFSTSVARKALEEYVKQKRKRKTLKTGSIQYPSSYVLAIARNLENEEKEKLLHGEKEEKNSVGVDPANGSHARIRKEQSNTISLASNQSLHGDTASNLSFHKDTRQISKRISQSKASTIPIIQEEKTLVSLDTAKRCVSNLVELEQPISVLKGVGPKTAEAFERLNLHTIRSLLWHFPSNFVDRTKLCTNVSTAQNGDIVTCVVSVESIYSGNGMVKVQCCDKSNEPLVVTYFCGRSRRAAAAYRKLFGPTGSQRVVSGKVQISKKRGVEMVQPDWVKPLSEMNSVTQIEPVYRSTKGLTQSRLRGAIDQALELGKATLECIPETLLSPTLKSLGWPSLADALILAHRPQSEADYEGGPASPPRMRLAFEELCIQQAHLALARRRYKAPFGNLSSQSSNTKGAKSWTDSPLVSLAVSLLPFSLTGAQEKCLTEAWNDAIQNEHGRMARLLQGDVSSGKTVVAYLLALGCLESRGGVAAILAPTTILANQHSRSLSEFLDALNQHLPAAANATLKKLHVELLTGSITGARREDVLEQLERCSPSEAYLLVGTHALLTDNVAERLGSLGDDRGGLSLAVVDEEQRFGVAQRGILSRCATHTLYMTATPIPRTLALGGYNSMAPFVVRTGSMDVSILDCKPEGVKPVKTSVVKMEKLDQVIHGVGQHLSAGAKVFWILPRIGLDETVEQDMENAEAQIELEREPEASSVVERYSSLSRILGAGRVGMVHGRMTTKEREAQLKEFADPLSGVDVLVGTTVLEVGIDIASVSILIVEGAERFGLSQLHQLRGRIGRTVKKDYHDSMMKPANEKDKVNDARELDCHCVLLTKESSIDSVKRLNVLRETNDGARVAMADFDLRGPGEMVGLQQAGLRNGFVVDLSHHFHLVEPAALFGRAFLETDMAKMLSDMAMELGKDGKGNSVLRILASNSYNSVLGNGAACTPNGFRIRASLAFFGNWRTTFDENNVNSALYNLRELSASNTPDSRAESKIEDLFEVLSNKLESSKEVSIRNSKVDEKSSSKRNDEKRTTPVLEEATVVEDSPVPDIIQEEYNDAFFQPVKSKESEKDKDMVFVVIDTETTGLSANSHVIQIAAKVLGSSDPNEQFSAYSCPPVHLDRVIEQLTGITEDFLRHGGKDEATGQFIGPAPPFARVYQEFCEFCSNVRNGKDICIIAHNAPFDIRMLNGEVRRLAAAARAKGMSGMHVPLFSRDTGIVSAIDTLKLVRSRELWRGSMSRPSSFSLGDVYTHIFGAPMVSAHNAYGDVLGLEKILLSKELEGWEKLGKKFQTPLAMPQGVTSNLFE